MIDITGDRIPEMIVSTHDTVNMRRWRWFVYVGRRGQRLAEQYGSGNDLPEPGSAIWWGRPWIHIWAPNHFDPLWPSPFLDVFDPGDIGLDGVGDFCALSYPRLIFNSGGTFLDSKIDATSETPLALGFRNAIARLGDIDGSGRPAIAIPIADDGVAFVQANRDVPRNGERVRLPDSTGAPLGSLELAETGASVTLSVFPNPVRDVARLSWPRTSSSTSLTLYDEAGREIRRWLLPTGTAGMNIELSGLSGGRYTRN